VGGVPRAESHCRKKGSSKLAKGNIMVEALVELVELKRDDEN
tara:strand:+ start:383 stop:508 length:126 start_codon:yes stop_codon:yes gene_type:complete